MGLFPPFHGDYDDDGKYEGFAGYHFFLTSHFKEINTVPSDSFLRKQEIIRCKKLLDDSTRKKQNQNYDEELTLTRNSLKSCSSTLFEEWETSCSDRFKSQHLPLTPKMWLDQELVKIENSPEEIHRTFIYQGVIYYPGLYMEWFILFIIMLGLLITNKHINISRRQSTATHNDGC